MLASFFFSDRIMNYVDFPFGQFRVQRFFFSKLHSSECEVCHLFRHINFLPDSMTVFEILTRLNLSLLIDLHEAAQGQV